MQVSSLLLLERPLHHPLVLLVERVIAKGAMHRLAEGEEPLQRKLKNESQRCDATRDKEKEGRRPGERPRPTRTDLLQGRDQELAPDTGLGVVGNNGGVLKV